VKCGQTGNDEHARGAARSKNGTDFQFQQLLASGGSWQQTLGAQFRPLFAPASAPLDLTSSFNLLVLGHESILSELKNHARKKGRSLLPAEAAVHFLGTQFI
jgi:hypothetical protein